MARGPRGEGFGTTNLYVEDLPDSWRLLYTITPLEHVPYIAVLEIVDHAAYDNWFPNRGK